MRWDGLRDDVASLFDRLASCTEVPKHFGLLYRLHDPHPEADAFLLAHDRANAVEHAKSYVANTPWPNASDDERREILRRKATIYNDANRERINAKQRLRDAAKRAKP